MITAGRWQRIEEIFHGAASMAAGERAAFVDGASGGDSGLRAEVERLLDSSEAVGDRFERLIGGAAAGLGREGEAPKAPVAIGPYRIDRLLGEGGMGAVYLAHRADGEFRRRVAIKLVRTGVHGADARRRFRHERQLLADLEHPNIARLLDGGTTPDGEPYLVMEYIDGEPIDVYCDRRRLAIADRVRLVRQVTKAVQHAHRAAVVHRDLKPSNILVTTAGQPKLLDFGIAKLLRDDGGRSPTLTGLFQRALTPECASPEQIRGGPITVATDVYSLGLLLYRLLTGLPAYDETGHGGGDLESVVCGQLPPRPSAAVRRLQVDRDIRLAGIAGARGTTPRDLARRLAGDLDRIVLEALRKEPAARYPSAERLGEDLERWLGGRPVEARAERLGRRVARLVHRHPAADAALATALVASALFGAADRTEPHAAADEAPATVARRSQAARLYSSALSARRQFDSRRARDLLLEAAAAEPGFALAHAALADAWRDLGHYGRAREASRRAVDLAGGLPRADRLSVEARHHLAMEAWDRAIEAHRTLATLFPDVPEPTLALAAAQTADGRADEALATLAELAAAMPEGERDPRIDLAEAEAAGALSDFGRQLEAARRAAAAGRARGAPLLVARARLAE